MNAHNHSSKLIRTMPTTLPHADSDIESLMIGNWRIGNPYFINYYTLKEDYTFENTTVCQSKFRKWKIQVSDICTGLWYVKSATIHLVYQELSDSFVHQNIAAGTVSSMVTEQYRIINIINESHMVVQFNDVFDFATAIKIN